MKDKRFEKYHWFCPEPWTNIVANPSGKYKPCCITNTNMVSKWEGTEYTTENHTYEEFWHSPFMKRLRKAMKDGHDDKFLYDVCRKCKNAEDIGVRSFREWYTNRFVDKEEFASDIDELERIVETDSEPTFYHSMEFLPTGGNTCNLSCLMCSSGYSSTHAKESIKIGNKVESPVIKPKIKKYPDIKKVRELKLTGGEPFMIKENLKLIEDAPDGILFRVITNGTITLHDYDIFKKFKKATFNISIEGPKEITEYIRHPSKWDVIQKNKEKFEALPNSNVIFVLTVNALNIHRISEIQGSHDGFVTNKYSVESIPDDIKEIYLDKLYSYGVNHNNNEKLITYLESSKYNELKMWKMLTDIKKRDQIRKTQLPDVIPEWKSYYDKVKI